MEQRRLRLGDILDDYCPRERRVTNHAVVALVEETVKQTRCTTCDAEHPYKGGKAPRRRKKDAPATLYEEVLAGKPDTDVPVRIEPSEPMAAASDADPSPEGDVGDAVDVAEVVELVDVVEVEDEVNGNVMTRADRAAAGDGRNVPVRRPPPSEIPRPGQGSALADVPARAADTEGRESDADERPADLEDGPVHRQLIRATLPRIEGHKEERRPTDFTIRQAGGRGNAPGNQFRGGGGGNDRMRPGARGGHGGGAGQPGGPGHRGNGQRPHGGPRFAGARPGQGQGQGRGQGGGFRSAQQPRQGGGRKRSR
jgi:hypothetical protein